MKNDKLFYTYLYRDIDGTPVYIGKGKGSRAWVHLRKSTNPHLGSLLRKRLEAGYIIEPSIGPLMSEDDAFLQEVELILKYGRLDKGTGTLFNHTDGGEGRSGSIATPAQIEAGRKAGLASKGRKATPTQIEGARKSGLASRGRKLGPTSQAQKDVMSQARKGTVTAFNLVTHETKHIPKDIFEAGKNTLYVGHTHNLAKEFRKC